MFISMVKWLIPVKHGLTIPGCLETNIPVFCFGWTIDKIVSMTKRLSGIDYLKFIATIGIIVFHCGMFENNTITMIAVGVFFCCSGYLFKEKTNGLFWRHILNLILTTMGYTLAYMLLNGYIHGNYGLTSMLNGLNLIDLLVFNENAIYAHLWFMGSYIYTLIITQYGLDHLSSKIKTIIMIPLWIISATLPLVVPTIPLCITRNFLLMGLPCFLLGQWIKANQDRLVQINPYCTLAMASVVTLINLMVIPENIDTIALIYSEPLLLGALMIVAIRISATLKNGRFIQLYSKTALRIYLIHPLVYQLINAVIIRFVNPVPFSLALIRTVSTIVISIIVAAAIHECSNRFISILCKRQH